MMCSTYASASPVAAKCLRSAPASAICFLSIAFAFLSLGFISQGIHTSPISNSWNCSPNAPKPEMWSWCACVAITTASFFPVSSAMLAMQSFIVPMLPCEWTPQSTRMCSYDTPFGMETRKQSPKPTRYMRMRILPFAAAFFLAAISVPPVRGGEVHRRVECVAIFEVGVGTARGEIALEVRLLPLIAAGLLKTLVDDVAHGAVGVEMNRRAAVTPDLRGLR